MNFYVAIGQKGEKLIESFAADDDQARRLIKEALVASLDNDLVDGYLKSWATGGYRVKLVEW